MPRELVTKAGRFYCVSLSPDICKTPMGASTPPIPYTIKGEFSEATGVSRDITSNGEPVVIHASTVVPTVTGDSPGTAKGIKSGTVGKRVQHDQKSSTVSFNKERAIREGDTVFMNDRNTSGKVFERGGGSAESVKQDMSFGDKFDAAMGNAAGRIRAGQQWLGDKVGRIAQTEAGSKALKGLQKLSEATELSKVKKWTEDKQRETMESAATMGGRGAGVLGSVTVAALEFIPTSLMDIVPGGRGGRAAGKGAKATGKVAQSERGAISGGKPGSKAQQVATASRTASQADKLSLSAPKPPKGGSDGGTGRGKGKKKKDKPNSCCPKNSAPGGKPVSSRHPVHFATGEEILEQTDFVLAGEIPIIWTRCYRSGSEIEDWSIFGARWSSAFTSCLYLTEQGLIYQDETGRALRLAVLAPGETYDSREEGFVLARNSIDEFALTSRDGSAEIFKRSALACLPHGYNGANAMLDPEPPILATRFDLCRSTGPNGRGLSIEKYAGEPGSVLLRVRSDSGRTIEAMRASLPERKDRLQADLSGILCAGVAVRS